jgi:peptidase E
MVGVWVKTGPHKLADCSNEGLQVGGGYTIDLLHKLKRVEAVAMRRRAVVPA